MQRVKVSLFLFHRLLLPWGQLADLLWKRARSVHDVFEVAAPCALILRNLLLRNSKGARSHELG